MVAWADNLTSVADILATSITDGEIRANLGDVDTADGITADAPMWGLDGFVSRPNDPTDEGAAQAIYIQDGQIKRIVSTRDNRFASKVGALQPGDRAIVSDCDARIFLKQATSSISVYTANQQDNDSSMVLELHGAEGRVLLLNGKCIMQMTKDEILFGVDQGGGIKIDSGGVQVFGPHFAANTAGGNFGLIGPIPPPVGATSVCVGAVGTAAVGSSKWTMTLAFVLGLNLLRWLAA